MPYLTGIQWWWSQVPWGENLPAWFQSIHCIECQTKRNIDVVETGTHALKDCPSVSEYYAAVSQAFEVPYSSTTLSGFFHNPGPRPNQMINYDMYSTLVWLAAIQLISYRNSQTPFDDAMICNFKDYSVYLCRVLNWDSWRVD